MQRYRPPVAQYRDLQSVAGPRLHVAVESEQLIERERRRRKPIAGMKSADDRKVHLVDARVVGRVNVDNDLPAVCEIHRMQ